MWDWFFKFVVGALCILMLGFWTILVGDVFFRPDTTLWREFLLENILLLGAFPGAGAMAFVVVYVFKATDGDIEFEVGPVKFRGASGPVVLWVFSFIVIVAGIGLLT